MGKSSQLLKQKADQTLDFLPNAEPKKIAETITAFANSDGGTLIVGSSLCYA